MNTNNQTNANTALTKEALIYHIALTQIEGIGAIQAHKLIEYFGSAEAVLYASKNELKQIPGIGPQRIQAILNPNLVKKAEKIYAEAVQHEVSMITFLDEGYPERLKACYGAPIVIYTKGNCSLANKRLVSIVGTRKSTSYGNRVTANIISDLKKYQPTIVSGLAFGIDKQAHLSALEQILPTIGVLACGLDEVYPKHHFYIAEKMMLTGGLISEYPCFTPIDPRHFPIRNRIIAGLSEVTIVVEAAAKGGAMITAKWANEYDREVYAVPGNINAPVSAGCHHLIQNHQAKLFTSVDELAEWLGWGKQGKPVQRTLPDTLSPNGLKICNILYQQNELVTIDQLLKLTDLTLPEISNELFQLELEGVLLSLPGNQIRLA